MKRRTSEADTFIRAMRARGRVPHDESYYEHTLNVFQRAGRNHRGTRNVKKKDDGRYDRPVKIY